MGETRVSAEWLESAPLWMKDEPLAVREAVVKALRDNKVRFVSELMLLAANAGSPPDFDGSVALSASFSEAVLGAAATSYREKLKRVAAGIERAHQRGHASLLTFDSPQSPAFPSDALVDGDRDVSSKVVRDLFATRYSGVETARAAIPSVWGGTDVERTRSVWEAVASFAARRYVRVDLDDGAGVVSFGADAADVFDVAPHMRVAAYCAVPKDLEDAFASRGTKLTASVALAAAVALAFGNTLGEFLDAGGENQTWTCVETELLRHGISCVVLHVDQVQHSPGFARAVILGATDAYMLSLSSSSRPRVAVIPAFSGLQRLTLDPTSAFFFSGSWIVASHLLGASKD